MHDGAMHIQEQHTHQVDMPPAINGERLFQESLPELLPESLPASLKETLVVTVNKGFWSSPEAKRFPNRIYTRRLMSAPGRFGSSRNPINNLSALAAGYLYYRRHRPKLILIGSANRVAPWFAALKGRGLLPGTQLIASTQSYLTDAQVAHLARVIIFSRKQIALREPSIRTKYVFIPLPAEGDYRGLESLSSEGYVFSGGGAGRDFATLIEAVRNTDIPLRIVTFSPATLGYTDPLPPNCTVEWRMSQRQFLERVATARLVVVPLIQGEHPHGHTTVVQALRLSKPVITTQNASCDDYIRHGDEGLLVEPGDVLGYRHAIQKLLADNALYAHCQAKTAAISQTLTYRYYAQAVAMLCHDVIQEGLPAHG